MKRTRKPAQADAIITADLHLRETAPVARTDDYMKAQAKKLMFLDELSSENGNCAVLCAGDIFDRWKASPWLCSWVLEHLPHRLITIPGNHDLPRHSFQQYDRSTLSLLECILPERRFRVLKNETVTLGADQLTVTGIPFGFDESMPAPSTSYRKVLMLHELVWPRRGKLEAKIGGRTGEEVLEKLGGVFDIIITGDNHKSFAVQGESAILVNPGSMMRMSADQVDSKPRCFLYYAEKNRVEPVGFPIEKGVLSRDHIDKEKNRDERIEAYIERMDQDWELGLSFQQNLQAFFQDNSTPKKVREIVWKHLETEDG